MPPRKAIKAPTKRAISTASPSLSPPPISKPVKSPKRAKTAVSTVNDEPAEDSVKPAKKARLSAVKGKAKIKAEADEDELSDVEDTKPAKKARTKKAKNEDGDGGESEVKKQPKQPKIKPFPPPELETSLHPPRQGAPPHPLSSLTSTANGGLLTHSAAVLRPHLLGAHTSIAGGPATALFRAGLAGANGLAMFLKSQRQWKSNPFEQEAIDRFRQGMKGVEEGGLGYGAESILVHGSYLINLGFVSDTATRRTVTDVYV